MVQAYKDVILLGVDKLATMFVIMSINDVMREGAINCVTNEVTIEG
jgi:hypothetical protein